MGLVMRGHFRSCDKDGSHTIRSAIAENPMLHTNFMALTFHRMGVIADQSFTLQKNGFSTFFCSCNLDLDPMTFIYKL